MSNASVNLENIVSATEGKDTDHFATTCDHTAALKRGVEMFSMHSSSTGVETFIIGGGSHSFLGSSGISDQPPASVSWSGSPSSTTWTPILLASGSTSSNFHRAGTRMSPGGRHIRTFRVKKFNSKKLSTSGTTFIGNSSEVTSCPSIPHVSEPFQFAADTTQQSSTFLHDNSKAPTAQPQDFEASPIFYFGIPQSPSQPIQSSEGDSVSNTVGVVDPAATNKTETNLPSDTAPATDGTVNRTDQEEVTARAEMCHNTSPVTIPASEKVHCETSTETTAQNNTVDYDDRSTWIHKGPIFWKVISRNMSKEMVRPRQSIQEQLLDAAYQGKLETVRELVNAGVNCRDTSGRTPLFHACEQGHTDVVKFLFEQGADLDIKNCDGDTPLHLLSKSDDAGLMEHLFQCRVWLDLDAVNHRGEKPLDCALINNCQKAAKMLLDRGANFSRKYSDGTTPHSNY